MISVYTYTDYRKYLNDYYEWAKKNVRRFSHRSFLAKAEMSGPNYLKKVMEGHHNLTSSSIQKFALALSLDDNEREYFEALVLFNQAETIADKDRYFEKLMELKAPFSQDILERNQYEYYRDWYNVAIREIMAYFKWDDNPAELAKEVSPPITGKQVKKSIDLLTQLGLLEFKEGKLLQSSRSIATGSNVQSLLIPKFHQTMAKLATSAIMEYTKEQRYFGSLSMSISKDTYTTITDKIREFKTSIAELVAEDRNPDRAYHLNFQLFPLSKPKTKVGRKKRV